MPGHPHVELLRTTEEGDKEKRKSRWRVPKSGILRTAHWIATDGAA